MATVLHSFQPLDEQSKNVLVDYNKRCSVDNIAQTLTTVDEYKNGVPAAVRGANWDKAHALEWLKSLIPDEASRAGDWRLYFVKSYQRLWIRVKYPSDAAAQMLADKIADYVTQNRMLKPNMGYYQEVRAIAVPDDDKFKADFDTHVKRKWDGVKCIAWRGDDRDPETMMKTGFSPRVSVSTPIWRPQDQYKDVDLDTTVCVARDIRGCAFFPLTKPVQYTWAYCVIVREGWNTYYLQKKLAEEKKIQPDDPQYKNTVWMFHEKCVNHIEPKDIVIAVQLERRIFDGQSPLSGIQFRLNNLNATGRTNFVALSSLTKDQTNKIDETLNEFTLGWYPSAPNQWLTYQGVVTK